MNTSHIAYTSVGIDSDRCIRATDSCTSWSGRLTGCGGARADAPRTRAPGQSAENVAVVINDNSPDSQKIGQAYAAARIIPDSNVLHIRTSTEETVERTFIHRTDSRTDRATRSAARRLHDRILYVVLTKGVPIAHCGHVRANRHGLERRFGTDAPVSPDDREWSTKAEGPVPNPYFLGDREVADARPFTHRDFDIFLVSRLDAYTIDEALALIDRAASAKGEGRIVLDQRDALVNRTGDDWLELASKRLAGQGFDSQVVLETTPKPARGVSPGARILLVGIDRSAEPRANLRSHICARRACGHLRRLRREDVPRAACGLGADGRCGESRLLVRRLT